MEELRTKGYEPYAYKWERSHSAKQLQDIYCHLKDGEECKDQLVSIAGRIIARRAFGKLAFLTLRDESGTIQVCLFLHLTTFPKIFCVSAYFFYFYFFCLKKVW